MEKFFASEGRQPVVGHEFDVLFHQVGVHANKSNGKAFGDEFLFNFHGIGDNFLDAFLWEFVDNVFGVEVAGEFAVQTFVAANEFIAGGQAWHQSFLF